jgi:hypothetical protein
MRGLVAGASVPQQVHMHRRHRKGQLAHRQRARLRHRHIHEMPR